MKFRALSPAPCRVGAEPGADSRSACFLRHLLINTLIALLHLPLIYQALSLYAALAPGKSIADLPATSLFTLPGLLILPYVLLSVLGIRRNPERARLNECRE